MARQVNSIGAATAFVRAAGVAVVLPIGDLVLPSLWEAMVGSSELRVFALSDSGKRVFTRDIERVWAMKNALAERRLACVGKHIRGKLTLVSRHTLPALYALTGRSGSPADFREAGELSRLQDDLAEALLTGGPQTAPQLRGALGVYDTRAVKHALTALHRMLIVTEAGERQESRGWASAIHDLLARRYERELRVIPCRADGQVTLAEAMLGGSGEITAADMAAVLGIRRAAAVEALERLEAAGRARSRKADGYTLWCRIL